MGQQEQGGEQGQQHKRQEGGAGAPAADDLSWLSGGGEMGS